MVNILFRVAFSLFLIVGPIVGYIPQYREIFQTGNADGFSTLVCFILLISNILRIFFWILKRFDVTLLLQSIVMISAQLILLELIMRIRLHQNRLLSGRHHLNIALGFSWTNFWSWNYFGQYLSFLIVFFLFGLCVTAVNLLVVKSSSVTELLGLTALMIEATLAMPQFLQNYRNKSCHGLRLELVGAWFAGDAFKVIYFWVAKSPFQFILCGAIQLAVDIGIGIQIFLYRKNGPPAREIISIEEGLYSHAISSSPWKPYKIPIHPPEAPSSAAGRSSEKSPILVMGMPQIDEGAEEGDTLTSPKVAHKDNTYT